MTQDEIIEMAVICGIVPWTKHEYIGENKFSASDDGLDGDIAALIQFAKLIAEKATDEANARSNASWTLMCKKMVAAEREACAEICDDMKPSEATFDKRFFVACTLNAQAIRARGQE